MDWDGISVFYWFQKSEISVKLYFGGSILIIIISKTQS